MQQKEDIFEDRFQKGRGSWYIFLPGIGLNGGEDASFCITGQLGK